MQAQKDVVVSIHYTLTSDNGEVIDSSAGKEPLDYLRPREYCPRTEEALEGASVGTELKVTSHRKATASTPPNGFRRFHSRLLKVMAPSRMVFVAQTEQALANSSSPR